MDIRSKSVGDKYREAKKFVEEYDKQYHKELCTWTPLEWDLQDNRVELSFALEFTKERPGSIIGNHHVDLRRKNLHKLLKQKHGSKTDNRSN